MEPGERVVFHELPVRGARLAAYIFSLGLFELWRRRTHFIVTDRRLIAVRGVVSRDRQIIPLDLVERVTVREGDARAWSTSLRSAAPWAPNASARSGEIRPTDWPTPCSPGGVGRAPVSSRFKASSGLSDLVSRYVNRCGTREP